MGLPSSNSSDFNISASISTTFRIKKHAEHYDPTISDYDETFQRVDRKLNYRLVENYLFSVVGIICDINKFFDMWRTDFFVLSTHTNKQKTMLMGILYETRMIQEATERWGYWQAYEAISMAETPSNWSFCLLMAFRDKYLSTYEMER